MSDFKFDPFIYSNPWERILTVSSWHGQKRKWLLIVCISHVLFFLVERLRYIGWLNNWSRNDTVKYQKTGNIRAPYVFHKGFGIYNWCYQNNRNLQENWHYPKERNLQDGIGVIEMTGIYRRQFVLSKWQKFTIPILCYQKHRNLQDDIGVIEISKWQEFRGHILCDQNDGIFNQFYRKDFLLLSYNPLERTDIYSIIVLNCTLRK